MKPKNGVLVLAYLVALTISICLAWKPQDLVWGLWASGLFGTLATIVFPLVLLTLFPGVDPHHDPKMAGQFGSNLLIASLLWGSLVLGYLMAGNMILGGIPLPHGAPANDHLWRGMPDAAALCLREYWPLIALNMLCLGYQTWCQIRSGEGFDGSPFVDLGRVLVICTLMVLLYLIRIDSVLVAVLLFLFYIPDDVFAERVLGLS